MKYVIDIDGVIAETASMNYAEAKPQKQIIEYFNNLYDDGNEIIYFTARGYETKINHSKLTEEQFKKWGVKYTDLLFNKPSADIYIDDKNVNISQLIPNKYISKTNKKWGIEYLLQINEHYVMKKLIINNNHNISLQYHQNKHETWYIEYGKGIANINSSITDLSIGDTIALPPNVIHQIKAIDGPLIIIECSTPQLEDIVRIREEFI